MNKDFNFCINWLVNSGYDVQISSEKFTGNMVLTATDYVDAAKEVPFKTITLKFNNWKCVNDGE